MSQRAVRGFVLQPTYRIESGRPVVHLYGRLEDGGSFLVQDDRLTPHFYIAARQAEQAGRLGAPLLVDSSLRTWSQEPAARVELRIPSHTPALRNRFIKHGSACYEADIRFAILYLISKGVRGSVELEGEWEMQKGAGRVYRNPEVRPTRWTPQLSVLSFDIETDPQASRLLSIALYGCGVSEVLLLEAQGRTPPQGTIPFPSQPELIRAFCRRVREIDPDILTGWNVIDFDLQVLDRLARQSGISMEMGRTPGALRLRPSRSPWSSLNASLPGRVVLDGIELLRTSFLRYDSYALDFVARRVLGQGKTLRGEGRAEEILQSYHNDLERFVEYNLNDARLVLDILQKLNLVELAVERSLLTGLPVNRVSGSIASFDFLYLSQLHKKGIVAPSVGSGPDDDAANLGGHVMEPQVGLYDNVCVFDFKSLYPSLIR
ncbi:MAG: 3'-5' exonuclease, partial [Acidobacteriota bacterium]